MGPEVFISMSEYPPCNTYTNERRSIDQISKQYVISTITTRSARSDNTCEGGVEPTENIYKIRERAVARHLFSFPNSQNVVLSVLSVATLRVASTVSISLARVVLPDPSPRSMEGCLVFGQSRHNVPIQGAQFGDNIHDLTSTQSWQFSDGKCSRHFLP